LDVATFWASAGFDVNRLGDKYYAEMRESVAAACDQNPDDPAGWYCRGRIHMFHQEREQAISALSRCIELAPDDWRALWCRSMTYMRLGKWQEGLTDGTAAMDAGADQALLPMYIMLANVKASFRQYEGALADFRKLVQLQPDADFNWFRMGILLAKLGLVDELREHCAKAAMRFRDNGSEILARVQLPLALSPDGADDWGFLAAEALRASKGRVPPILKAFIELDAGAFQYRAGRYEEALELIAPNLAQLPEAGRIRGYAILAMVHHRLGQMAEANESLKQSRDLQELQFPEVDANNIFEWANRLMGLIWYDEAVRLMKEA
jgi:tetratricopeptide (TPR) repeat protein